MDGINCYLQQVLPDSREVLGFLDVLIERVLLMTPRLTSFSHEPTAVSCRKRLVRVSTATTSWTCVDRLDMIEKAQVHRPSILLCEMDACSIVMYSAHVTTAWVHQFFPRPITVLSLTVGEGQWRKGGTLGI